MTSTQTPLVPGKVRVSKVFTMAQISAIKMAISGKNVVVEGREAARFERMDNGFEPRFGKGGNGQNRYLDI